MDLALRVFRSSKIEEIIKASDVDTNSLKDLVTKCVICGEFVDFVPPNSEEAKKNRAAYFKHRPHKNKLLVLACENRVKSMSEAEIQKRQKDANRQRQKWIKDTFWRVFRTHYESINFPIGNISDALTPFHRKAAREMLDFWKETARHPDAVQKTQEQAHRILDIIWSGERIVFSANGNHLDGSVYPKLVQKSFTDLFLGRLNQNLQKAIVSDVIDFLYQPRNLHLVQALLEIGVYVITDTIIDSGGPAMGLIPKNQDWSIKIGDRTGFNARFWLVPYNRKLCFQYAADHVILWVSILPYPLLID